MTDNGVLVLTGPPCAGKSSVGKVLAADWLRGRGVHLEVDALCSLLLPGSDRNRNDRMFAYHAAHALARMVLERGQTPLLECTYSRLEQRASLLKALADVPGAPLWIVEFEVLPDDAVQRFRRRRQATDLDEQLVRKRAEVFPYSAQALRLVSSAAAPEDLAHQITTWLGKQPGSIQRDLWAEAGQGWE
nr:AAA family ATPase [Catellatospora sichuanensis]